MSSILTLVLLAQVPAVADDARPDKAAVLAAEAVNRYLSAMQKNDSKAAIALWPDDLRKVGETLIPLGEATRKAREKLEAAMLDKFGGKKGDHRIDPNDLLPVVFAPGLQPGVKIDKWEIGKCEKLEDGTIKVNVKITFQVEGKEGTEEISFLSEKGEESWKVQPEKTLLRLRLTKNAEKVKAFSETARAVLEKTEQAVRDGTLKSQKDVTEALKEMGPVLRVSDLEEAKEAKPEDKKP